MRPIQIYAPHGGQSNEEYTQFLDDLTAVVNEERSTFTVVMGDFNAIVGARIPGEQSVGNFGLGTRNPRGQQLVDFCENNRMKITNTFFKKRHGKK